MANIESSSAVRAASEALKVTTVLPHWMDDGN